MGQLVAAVVDLEVTWQISVPYSFLENLWWDFLSWPNLVFSKGQDQLQLRPLPVE